MPSSYSENLRLELQATGENRSTWGIKANNDFVLIEKAIAGYLSIAMSDADMTLTAIDGATDQSRNAILEFTGTLTASRNITIPSVSKIYIIKNSTTGDFQLIFKTAVFSSQTFTLDPNTTVALYCNGADVYPALSLTDKVEIGDFLSTARTLDSKWLRRDGSIYLDTDYPDLAPLLPPVNNEVIFTSHSNGTVSMSYMTYAFDKYSTGVGAGGPSIYSSTNADLDTWNSLNTNLTETFSIGSSPTAVVVGGINANISISLDGTSFTTTNIGTGTGSAPFVVMNGNSTWVFAGNNGGGGGFIVTSANLSVFVDHTPGGTPLQFNTGSFTNGIFVVGITASSTASLYASTTNGASWTGPVTVSSTTGAQVLSANGFFILPIDTGGRFVRSVNGSSWGTTTSTGLTGRINSLSYDSTHGVYIVTTTTGGFALSANLTSWTIKLTGVSSINASVYNPDDNRFLLVGNSGVVLDTQVFGSGYFRVPDDDHTYDYIRALA